MCTVNVDEDTQSIKREIIRNETGGSPDSLYLLVTSTPTKTKDAELQLTIEIKKEEVYSEKHLLTEIVTVYSANQIN